MHASLLLCALIVGQEPGQRSLTYQPSFSLDHALRTPAVPYEPLPGDIFLATGPPNGSQFGRALWLGHLIAGAPGIHHSAIFFRRSNGKMAILEAGPFNELIVAAVEPYDHLQKHMARNNRCWVRKRLTPLTAEQSAKLTAFAERQMEKPFAIFRGARHITPFRARGPWTKWVGHPKGDRNDWYCAELVSECLVASGVVDANDMRPSATFPRDLFFGTAINPYLKNHLPINAGWEIPTRWVLGPAE